MKFKVGDEVTIRPDLRAGGNYMGYYATSYMKSLSSTRVRIAEIKDGEYYRIEKDGEVQNRAWTDAMFVESKIDTFFVGDPVIYVDKKSGEEKEAIVIQTHGTKRIRYDLDIGVVAYRSYLKRVKGHDYSMPYNPNLEKDDYVVIAAKLRNQTYGSLLFSNHMSHFYGTVTQIKSVRDSIWYDDVFTVTNERLGGYVFHGLMLEKLDPGTIKVGDRVIYRDRIEEVSDIIDDVSIRIKGLTEPIRKYAIQPISEYKTIKLKKDIFGVGNAGDIELVAVGKYLPDYYANSIGAICGRLFDSEFDEVIDNKG